MGKLLSASTADCLKETECGWFILLSSARTRAPLVSLAISRVFTSGTTSFLTWSFLHLLHSQISTLLFSNIIRITSLTESWFYNYTLFSWIIVQSLRLQSLFFTSVLTDIRPILYTFWCTFSSTSRWFLSAAKFAYLYSVVLNKTSNMKSLSSISDS